MLRYAAVLAAGILLGMGVFAAGEKLAERPDLPEDPGSAAVQSPEEQPPEEQTPEEQPPKEPEYVPEEKQETQPAAPPASGYVSIDVVKHNVIKDAYTSADSAEFLSIELDETGEVPVYHVVMETGNGYYRFVYEVGAESGLCRDRVYYTGDNYIEEGGIGRDGWGDYSLAEEPYNQYWELNCKPSGQAFYPDMPVIDTWDYHEGYWDGENRIWVYPDDAPPADGENGSAEIE